MDVCGSARTPVTRRRLASHKLHEQRKKPHERTYTYERRPSVVSRIEMAKKRQVSPGSVEYPVMRVAQRPTFEIGEYAVGQGLHETNG